MSDRGCCFAFDSCTKSWLCLNIHNLNEDDEIELIKQYKGSFEGE